MDMYFVAIVCPAVIDHEILKWKLWMKEKYECEVALRSPAHITLVPPFWMKPELENDLVSSLINFSTDKNTFNIQLNHFSCFKPRVIFVDVVQNTFLADLNHELHRFLLLQDKYPVEKDDRPFHPHVTIATRDLHKKSFHEAWEYFKEKKFQAEWRAQGLSLLRHNKKNWDVIATSQFRQIVARQSDDNFEGKLT